MKGDLEKDIRSLEIHSPSSDFTSKVTMKAVQQMEAQSSRDGLLKWIPRVIVIGFVGVFIVLAVLVLRFYQPEPISSTIALGLKVVTTAGIGALIIVWLDYLMKRIILH